jgi:threonine efflux protein
MPPVLVELATSYALVLAVPGPNTLVIARTGLMGSHRALMAAALGIACGAGTVAAIAALGAGALPSGTLVSRLSALAFAGLLLRSAAGALRPRPSNAAAEDRLASPMCGVAFATGLMVAVSNPTSVPWFLVFFAAHPVGSRVAILLSCAIVFAMAFAWFSLAGVCMVRFQPSGAAGLRPLAFRRLLAAALALMAARVLWCGFAG